METPLRIMFRHVASAEAVERKIHERAAKLETYYDRIIG